MDAGKIKKGINHEGTKAQKEEAKFPYCLCAFVVNSFSNLRSSAVKISIEFLSREEKG
jgi:hypothetical protein